MWLEKSLFDQNIGVAHQHYEPNGTIIGGKGRRSSLYGYLLRFMPMYTITLT